MKLWIGGEIQAEVADSFRMARLSVEKTINENLENKNYDILLTDWDCIAILRDDDDFAERTTYSKKKKDMDFRLKIDYSAFTKSDSKQQESLIFQMLQRSISILKQKEVGFGIDQLIADVSDIGKTRDWI